MLYAVCFMLLFFSPPLSDTVVFVSLVSLILCATLHFVGPFIIVINRWNCHRFGLSLDIDLSNSSHFHQFSSYGVTSLVRCAAMHNIIWVNSFVSSSSISSAALSSPISSFSVVLFGVNFRHRMQIQRN